MNTPIDMTMDTTITLMIRCRRGRTATAIDTHRCSIHTRMCRTCITPTGTEQVGWPLPRRPTHPEMRENRGHDHLALACPQSGP